ncbi:hypothetical protein M426DRAFT_18309 [Hypoxylon sp. CI-4A]|nr:hypothetical protein M426DRAFT_18309 [Hypoxylon sp. CI-4A]
MYVFMHVNSGQLWPPPADMVKKTEQYYKGQLILLMFFYTSLWSVKLSFLFFFKRLGQNVDKQKYLWWPIFAFTAASYFVCVGDIEYKCLAPSLEVIIATCSSDANIDFTIITFKVNCALDVVTDFLIMIIPITMVWNTRLRWRKKLALIGIFSLVIVTMIFSIVRVLVTSKLSRQPDTSWLYLWSSIEQCIAIIVACISAFPRLFTQSNRAARPVFVPSDTYRSMMKRIKMRRDEVPLSDLSVFSRSNINYTRAPDIESGQFLTPATSQSSNLPVMPRAYEQPYRNTIGYPRHPKTRQGVMEFIRYKTPGSDSCSKGWTAQKPLKNLKKRLIACDNYWATVVATNYKPHYNR